jgi:hypothetical protein
MSSRQERRAAARRGAAPATPAREVDDAEVDCRAFLARGLHTPQALSEQLCRAARYDERGRAAALLVAAGAPLEMLQRGFTPLGWAVQCANAAAVRVLLDAGADVHTLSSAGTGLVVSLLLAPSFASEPGQPARALLPRF